MKKSNVILMAIAASALVACTDKKMNNDAGIKPENLDTTATAGDDFYQFACGGWMESHPLTAEYARYGSFDKLAEDNREQLRGIIDEITSKENEPGSLAQKIADVYNLVMDTTRREAEGIEPIKPVLADIAAISERADVEKVMIKHSIGAIDGYFGLYIGADMMDSKSNLVSLGQSGLTLGEKEYYLDTDEATTAIREAYKQHIANMFGLCGWDEAAAQQKMESVMRIETRLAKASKSATELRDPASNYHKMAYDELKAQFPGISWDAYCEALGLSGISHVDVGQPEFFHEVEAIFADADIEDEKAYMEWQVIDNAATKLTKALDDEHFAFFGKVLSGRQEQQPWWKRATATVSGVLGEALGQLYVEKYFPATAKERMVNLVANLQTALGERIDAQEWMSDTTKAKAHEKLDAFYVKVGYPDEWKDYSKLTIDPAKTYYDNMQAASEFFWNDMLDRKLGKPVDPTEWHMTPQTVNAYYNPTTNEICCPAGILQYPFFDMAADDAFNYGAIGVVIGHEMTHGFDDQGRQFDKEGNFNNWWTDVDAEQFTARTQVLVDHFNGIEVLPGLFSNGQLTLGENIADHGGLMIAYQAFKNATKDQPQEVKYGFTPDQRFVLAYAGVWAGQIRDEEIRNRVKSDPHSLGRWRVNGTLPHIDAWYEAFGVTPDNSLYIAPEERAKIW